MTKKINSCVIVIPIYKVQMEDFELTALKQCLEKLKVHDIKIFTYEGLDISSHKEIFDHYNCDIEIEYFDHEYFIGLQGYNKLLMSSKFYQRFLDYQYMLIYQLDCFVFRDELNYWCLKGYDYIGAPWFNEHKSKEDGATLWKVGNGGLSLRKIKSFYNILSSKSSAYSLKYWLKQYFNNKILMIDLLKNVVLKHNNNIDYLVKNWNDAEDIFFCLKLEDTTFKLNTPKVEEALGFAFERSPQYLFDMNGKHLPFGCHAWQKYDYKLFWSKFIQ